MVATILVEYEIVDHVRDLNRAIVTSRGAPNLSYLESHMWVMLRGGQMN